MSKIKENVLIVYVILIAIFLGILIAGSIAFYTSFQSSETITSGVFIKSVNVSGMTQNEAKTAVTNYLKENMANNLVLKYSNYEYNVAIEQIEAEFDVDSAVNYAFNIGRTKNFFGNVKDYISILMNKIDIDPKLKFNEEDLENYMDFLEVSLPDQVEQPSYYIEDGNLVITTGSTGAGIKKENLKNLILDGLQNNSYGNTIYEIPTYTTYPDSLDVDSIYNDVHKDVSNAYFTKEPYAIYAETVGVDFNVDDVKNTVTEFGTNQEYKFKLNYTYPEVTIDDLGMEAFPDLLGTYSTNYVNNENRTTNLRLASSKINGTVLMPGETFSFNSIVGPRTAAKGYKKAAIYTDGTVSQDVGGGICQIVTTLYNAAVKANMNITVRRNHTFVPSYSKPGYDATVVYGSQDFKFVNSRNYPVKIVSSVSGGVATVSVYGLKTDNEYDIRIETNIIRTIPRKTSGGYTGYVVDSYRVYYQNGVQVKSEKIARDTYSAS